MQKSVLVTGANGFIGKYLVNLLSLRGYHIYASIRSKESDASFICEIQNVDIIYCDMSEYNTLEEKLKGVKLDAIYHLAWTGSSGILRGDYNIQLNNVNYSMQLIEVAHKLNVGKIIFAGSITQIMYRDYLKESKISPEIVTCYAIAKITCEYMAKCLCEKLNIEMNWTYISNFYGAGDYTNNFINFLIKSYKCGKAPVLTSGEQKADFMYVSDVGRALIKIAESGTGGESYYVGYGEPCQLSRFVTQVRDIVNKSCDTGLGKKDFNGKDINFDSIDINKLHRETGFVPQIKFSEGIRLLLESEKKNE